MAGIGKNPRVVFETLGGDVYDVPVYDLEGNPAPINLTPIDPFDQISVVGDTARALDRRVDRIIPSDQTGGAGRNKYDETEGVTDFRQSDADTRRKGAIVCRPKRTQMATVPLTAGLIALGIDGARAEYTARAGATWHIWWDEGNLYYWDGAAWVQAVGITGSVISGYVNMSGAIYVTGTQQVFVSTDGINFAALTPLAGAPYKHTGLALWDNKLWYVTQSGVGTLAELYAVDPATGTETRVLMWPLKLPNNRERIVKLFSWFDGAGSPALFIMTSRRLLAYNPVGGTIEEYDDFTDAHPEALGVVTTTRFTQGNAAVVYRETKDLYVAQGRNTDYLMRYSPGAGYGKVTPNRHGGLAKSRQGNPVALATSPYGIGVWTAPTAVVGGTGVSYGAGWFLDAQGGWHMMNRDLSSTRYVIGGGIGNREFITIFSDGRVESQPLPSVGALPQFAVGQKYDVNTDHVHNYARTDFGTEGTRFALLGFDLHTLKSDGTDQPGLDADTSVEVEYNLDGTGWQQITRFKDTNGDIQILAGFAVTAAQAGIGFPVRLIVNFEWGDDGYDLEWRVTLRTTNEDQTPVVVYCAPRAKKTPPPHYSYEFVVDALDFRHRSSPLGGAMALPMGKSPTGLHQQFETFDQLGTMVRFTYGIGGQQRTDICEFAMAPQLHPQAGIGRYRVSLRSVASDPSG